MKPLKVKSYGSIPHLPSSRMGPADHHCHEGQADIATQNLRDFHDRVIVTLKMDGCNVAVANVEGLGIVALNRAGFLAETSPYIQHRQFGEWVRASRERFAVIPTGYRMVGEWLALAHGTRYIWPQTEAPFVPFDVFDAKNKRLSWDACRRYAEYCYLSVPPVLHDSRICAVGVDAVMKLVRKRLCREMDEPEGAVWRVERDGEFDFMAKYVRPDKVDGSLLSEKSGERVWNWRLEGFDHEG